MIDPLGTSLLLYLLLFVQPKSNLHTIQQLQFMGVQFLQFLCSPFPLQFGDIFDIRTIFKQGKKVCKTTGFQGGKSF